MRPGPASVSKRISPLTDACVSKALARAKPVRGPKERVGSTPPKPPPALIRPLILIQAFDPATAKNPSPNAAQWVSGWNLAGWPNCGASPAQAGRQSKDATIKPTLQRII